MTNILTDSGFWYALMDERDQHHAKAILIAQRYFVQGSIFVIPYPILYETLDTRFVKRKLWMNTFNDILSQPTTKLIYDEPYKSKALQAVRLNSQRSISLVDMTLRLMLADFNLNIQSLITFNVGDFEDVCREHCIELIYA